MCAWKSICCGEKDTMNRLKLLKRGQEEIVGFVAVVIIVSIIILLALSISLRQKPERSRESREVRQFLESVMKYTSECALSYEPNYASLGELLPACLSAKKCTSGKEPCDVFEDNMNDILDKSWKVGGEYPISGYNFTTSYRANSTANTEDILISIGKGSCDERKRFASEEIILPATFKDSRGNILSIMKVCSS